MVDGGRENGMGEVDSGGERVKQRGRGGWVRRQWADSEKEKMNTERGIKEGSVSMDGY